MEHDLSKLVAEAGRQILLLEEEQRCLSSGIREYEKKARRARLRHLENNEKLAELYGVLKHERMAQALQAALQQAQAEPGEKSGSAVRVVETQP